MLGTESGMVIESHTHEIMREPKITKSSNPESWQEIDWKEANKQVRAIQDEIARAAMAES